MKIKPRVSKEDTRRKFLEYMTKRNVEERRYKKFLNELKYVNRLKTLTAPQKMLDLGCGVGLLTAFWTEQGINGHGIDIDFSLIRNAKGYFEKKGMKAQFIVGRLELLPYKDSLFDICVANSVLEHVQDWKATLKEVTRVLKPGGLFLSSTTNKIHPFQHEINHFPFYPWIPDRIKKRMLARIMKHRPDLVNYTEYPAIHWFTYGKLKAFLNDLGYKTYSRIDLIEKFDLKGWKATVKPLLPTIKKTLFLRYVYYFHSTDVSMYAIKLR